MRTIKVFDSANYEPHWTKHKRDSARAIIFVGDKLLMVRSQKYGEYKFPGGGINPGETHIKTLVREVLEETGHSLLVECAEEYGKTLNMRKGWSKDEIFEQESFYYICKVDETLHTQPSPDDGYEKDYGYTPILVSLDDAISANEKLLDMPEIPWTERDLFVLRELKMIKEWEAEENHAFQGWDFSHLDGRWDSPETPWDYESIVKSYLKDDDILLDMGTGGGEVLLSLNHPYKNTYATEAYEPNYELCKKVLSPLGITVARTFTDENLNADDKIPFEDNMFDVVINRHESFDLTEVDRVLKSGGYFITQQVGGKNYNEIAKRLNDNFIASHPNHTVKDYVERLTELGFKAIKTNEAEYPAKFYDVGALVFYAKIIVWEYPGFSVKTHLGKLIDCQREIEEKGFLAATGHRFFIVARKVCGMVG